LDALALPREPCPICLLDIVPAEEPVRRTPCYHTFHARCLLGSVRYQRERMVERAAVHAARGSTSTDHGGLHCPLCRLSLDDALATQLDVRAVLGATHMVKALLTPTHRNFHDYTHQEIVATVTGRTNGAHGAADDAAPFVIPDAVRAACTQWSASLQRQREAGGLIDLEENQRRLRVDATTVVRLPPPPPKPAAAAPQAEAAAGHAHAQVHHPLKGNRGRSHGRAAPAAKATAYAHGRGGRAPSNGMHVDNPPAPPAPLHRRRGSSTGP